MKKILFILSLTLVVTGCTSVASNNKDSAPTANNSNSRNTQSSDGELPADANHTKLKAIDCQKEQRGADVLCNDIYKPVCGYKQVECVKAPCDPIKQTFGNSCEACRDEKVLSYTEGECAKDEGGANSPDTDNNSWLTTTNDKGITFQYPKELSAKYISTVKWPPVISIDPIEKNQEFVCAETAPESSLAQRTTRRMVGDRSYCLYTSSEGAAGSVYTDYTYSAKWNEKIVKINFTLQYPRCDNYDEPRQTECQKERESFDLDNVVDRIFSSLEIIVD